jgi:(p)ppGpp synthase/HD superfamily hydrolase
MAKGPLSEENLLERGDVSDLSGSRHLTLGVLGDILHISSKEVPKGFLHCCNEIVALLDKERLAQGKRLLGANERIVLIHEMYRTCLEHKGRKRKSGTGYFDDHLCGATKILIELEGMVGLSTVLATLKHDNVEDLMDEKKLAEVKAQAEAEFDAKFPSGGNNAWRDRKRAKFVEEAVGKAKKDEEKKLSGELIDTTKYRGDLDLDDDMDNKIEQLVVTVQALVSGVTKFRKAKSEETAEATFKRLLEVAMEHIRAIYIKLADRLHNTKTIEGHGDRETQERIMAETEVQYLSLARILRMRKMVECFVDTCCKFFNEDLHRQFQILADERRANFGDKNRRSIKRSLKKISPSKGDIYSVFNVKFMDLGLENYMALVEKSFKEMTLQDLQVGPFDPMQEILVTIEVKDPAHRMAALNQVALAIEAKFASDDMAHFSRKTAPVGDPDNMFGTKAVCYNPDFGHLRFRINDRVSEARSKRGVLAEDGSQSTPADVKAMITTILNRTLRNFHGTQGVKQVAKAELLRPRIEVLTPGGEIVRLPRNSTGLDFAAAVHGDLLVNMSGMMMLPTMTSMDTSKPFDPFDALKDGNVYIVQSHHDGKSDVKPEWLLFANTIAAGVIRSHLSKDPNPEARGLEYLTRLSAILNISVNELLQVICKKYGEKGKSVQQVYKEVAMGIINPVAIFGEYIEFRNNRWSKGVRGRKSWKYMREEGSSEAEVEGMILEELNMVSKWEIEVLLPEEAGSLRAFSEEFNLDVGIKIDHIKSHIPGRDGKSGKLNLIFDLDDNEISIYDFFTKLIKLNLKYSAKIANPIVNKLADLKGGGGDFET